MTLVPPSSDSVREHWLGGESSDSGDTQEEALAMSAEEATLGWSERTMTNKDVYWLVHPTSLSQASFLSSSRESCQKRTLCSCPPGSAAIDPDGSCQIALFCLFLSRDDSSFLPFIDSNCVSILLLLGCELLFVNSRQALCFLC